MVIQLSKYKKNHWIVHFKQVNFMVCKFYLNKAVKNEKINISYYPCAPIS